MFINNRYEHNTLLQFVVLNHFCKMAADAVFTFVHHIEKCAVLHYRYVVIERNGAKLKLWAGFRINFYIFAFGAAK